MYTYTQIDIYTHTYTHTYIVIVYHWFGHTCAATKHIDLLLSLKGILCLDVKQNVLEANHRTNVA